MDTKRIQTIFFSFSIAAAGILAFFVLRPFLYSLPLAPVFALVFAPFHRKLAKLFGGRKSIAAIVSALIVFLVILIPLAFFGTKAFVEGHNLYTALSSGQENSEAILFIQKNISRIAPNVFFDISDYARKAALWLVQNLGSIFSGVTQALTELVISFLAMFFFLRDADRIKRVIRSHLPFDEKYGREIAGKLTIAARAVVKGTLITAVCQGIAAGIGFWIFGVPNPALWGFVAIFAALIPVLGTIIIILPAAIYVAVGSAPILALALVLWGVFVVGSIDNVLRPLLLEKGVRVHPFLVLLSVLGGLEFFGPLGFIFGPIVLSFFFALLGAYDSSLSEKA